MTRHEIARRLAEVALLRGRFTLRSGRESDYYLDKYRFSTQPDLLAAIGGLFAERVARLPGVTKLAGAELGGIPLVSAASIASGIPCVFIRNRKKGYGTGQQVEGVLEPPENIVIIEDIATSGGQVLEAAQVLTGAGATVQAIIATIDRLEGARANVERAGYAFDALFTIRDLGIDPGA